MGKAYNIAFAKLRACKFCTKNMYKKFSKLCKNTKNYTTNAKTFQKQREKNTHKNTAVEY